LKAAIIPPIQDVTFALATLRLAYYGAIKLRELNDANILFFATGSMKPTRVQDHLFVFVHSPSCNLWSRHVFHGGTQCFHETPTSICNRPQRGSSSRRCYVYRLLDLESNVLKAALQDVYLHDHSRIGGQKASRAAETASSPGVIPFQLPARSKARNGRGKPLPKGLDLPKELRPS